MAVIFTGAVVVPVSNRIDDEAMKFLIDNSEVTTIFCATEEIQRLVDLKERDNKFEDFEQKMQKLKCIVSFDNLIDLSLIEAAQEIGILVKTFDEVLRKGSKNKQFEIAEAQPDDVIMLSYNTGCADVH